MQFDIYGDIAKRTGGDIYLGVVGPVRTGKSTFIKRFMELLVMPRIKDKNVKTRTQDELPQSADGKTIMTTEPKFVPANAVEVSIEKVSARMRLIDCVGFIVKDALGHSENGKPRMVKTPWTDGEMPFEQAGELGTQKVIRDHSTIGIVVTTDGTVTDLGRSSYIDAEEKVVAELKAIKKPFVIVLNTKTPNSVDTENLRQSLAEKYGVPVVTSDVLNAGENDFKNVLAAVLYEFPVKRVDINVPKWMRTLPAEHPVMKDVFDRLTAATADVVRLADYERVEKAFDECENIQPMPDVSVSAGDGVIAVTLKAADGLFYKALSDWSGIEIDDEFKLISYVKRLAAAEKDYEAIRVAMAEVDEDGYGIVVPDSSKIELMEPEICKKGSQCDLKLKASASTYHILKVDVETEMRPNVGAGRESEYLVSEYEEDKNKLWEANMFGKSLSSLVKDDLAQKVYNMPADARDKMRRTVTRIVNESKGGVLCILL